jgi:hypothetical protein
MAHDLERESDENLSTIVSKVNNLEMCLKKNNTPQLQEALRQAHEELARARSLDVSNKAALQVLKEELGKAHEKIKGLELQLEQGRLSRSSSMDSAAELGEKGLQSVASQVAAAACQSHLAVKSNGKAPPAPKAKPKAQPKARPKADPSRFPQAVDSSITKKIETGMQHIKDEIGQEKFDSFTAAINKIIEEERNARFIRHEFEKSIEGQDLTDQARFNKEIEFKKNLLTEEKIAEIKLQHVQDYLTEINIKKYMKGNIEMAKQKIKEYKEKAANANMSLTKYIETMSELPDEIKKMANENAVLINSLKLGIELIDCEKYIFQPTIGTDEKKQIQEAIHAIQKWNYLYNDNIQLAISENADVQFIETANSIIKNTANLLKNNTAILKGKIKIYCCKK